MNKWKTGIFLLAISAGLAACTGAAEPPPVTVEPPADRAPADKYDDYTIVTLLPRDAIPAIDEPQFLMASEANSYYDDDELVIGVAFDGDARAYSVPFLSGHEIVNDTVGGRPIAVTW